MIQLRPYQQTAIDEARLAYRTHRSVLFQLPTGAGKTVTASTVVQGAARKGNATWWLTHRRELATQASATFHDLGIPHGTVRAGHISDPHALVQVASIQTIVRRLDKLPSPDLIVFDECVAGESVVETDRGPVAIKDIAADGTKALCQIDGKLVFRTITKAWKSGSRDTLKLCLSNGEVLICTPDHRIYLDGQWIESQKLKIGQRLASPAAFASAGAAAPSLATVGAAPDYMHPVTRMSGQGSTGMRGLLRWLLTLLPARAAVVSKSPQQRRTLRHSANGGAASHTGHSSSVTISDRQDLDYASTNLSAPPFLALCWEMAASVYRTHVQPTPASRGRMASLKRLGSITRALRFGDCGPSSTSRAMLDSVMSAFGCTLRASLASLKYVASSLPTGRSASLANGSTHLVMSGLRGGIAMTATGQTAFICIPRAFRKPKIFSSRAGLDRHPSTITARDIPTSAFTAPTLSKSLNASAHSSPSAWDTNCPTIERIEDGPKVDVFDLTVDEAHNFFANGVLVHNCHHIASGQWEAIFNAFPSARVLGLTATPWRLDGKGLGHWFGHMIEGPAVADLIEQGSLCSYRLFAPAMPDLSGVKTSAGDYQRGALAQAMDRPAIVGDAISHYRRLCAGKRAVVFAAGVENSKRITAQFREAGIPAEHVDGTMRAEERDAAVERFRLGNTLILSNADLFGEGFDVPAIEAAILLRPTKSLSLYLQQVGRALRPFPGKSEAVILDHAGNSVQHGLPDDEREWSLADREKRRKAETGQVATRQCSECFYVYRPAVKCPNCGHVEQVKARELEQVEGLLEEVQKVERRAKFREQGQANSLEALVELGRQRGYKNPAFWARKVWASRSRRAA